MSLRNLINEEIILPVSDIFLGQSIAKDFKFLLESQWWSTEQLENHQNEKLISLINHSYNNVPYYREVFDKLHLKPSDISKSGDLHKLPILTKNEIRKNFVSGKIIAKNIPINKLRLSSSSGSTGEPLQYYRTKASHSFHYACGIRGWYWMGYRLGDKYVKLSQNPRNNINKKLQDLANRTLYLFSQQLTNQNLKLIIYNINRFKPDFIRGYPDPMFFLANYIKRFDIKIHSPKAITTTGNILFPHVRQIIEEQFNCKVFDSYSCEGGAIVAECESHNCYHSAMEYAITEIIPDNIVINEKRGRVITTDLYNYAMPLIRYDTQDYLTKSKNNCSCGRNLLAIDKIDGRDSDILVTPSGKFLIVHNFTGYFEWIDSVDQFQIRQDKIDKIDILIKINKKFTQDMENEILKYWQNYIGENVKIVVHQVDEVPLTKSGKRRFLVRNANISLNL